MRKLDGVIIEELDGFIQTQIRYYFIVNNDLFINILTLFKPFKRR
jgi:hypothetical protein